MIFVFDSSKSLAQNDPDPEWGVKPLGSYQWEDIDRISLANGALGMTILLASYPQRGVSSNSTSSQTINAPAFRMFQIVLETCITEYSYVDTEFSILDGPGYRAGAGLGPQKDPYGFTYTSGSITDALGEQARQAGCSSGTEDAQLFYAVL